MNTAYVDGKYVPLEEANVSILDLGLIHCDSTYDVCHVKAGKFFRLDWHMDRFFRSADGLRLAIPLKREQLQNVLNECVSRSRLKDAFVWMVCLRGVPASGNPRDLKSCQPKLIAYAKPYYPIKVGEKNNQPIRLVVSKQVRFPMASMDPRFKSFHWGDLTAAQLEAQNCNADTALLLDLHGNITEGPGFNVFVVKGSKVITPRDNVLEGITRKAVVQICQENQMSCEVRDLSLDELKAADEVFITSTSGGVTPVSEIDNRPLNPEGEVTALLSRLYWEKHDSPDWTTPVKYS